ncbi:MAG: hypothetical protein RLZZ26_359 [Candidatus Parcubacteria bacterium]
MTSRARIFFGLLLAITLIPSGALAQSVGLSVSITPPLFDLTIGPGDTWSSSVKVINTGTSPTTYYSYVADFKATGETGNASFVPLLNEKNDPTLHAYSLASWISLSTEPVTVPASGSGQIPFTIHVPAEAEPGGHYAAVLIGTQPSTGSTTAGTQVNIASYVSSLLFVKIKGDVIENGRIREFSTSQSLYQSSNADFTLRFENTGNTHVQPQGNIVIYNMWGRERGTVSINQDEGNFGNVLPGSVRRFQFSWTGDNPFDIGRYSAVATLAFGQDGKKNVSATTYFWVIPVVPVASAVVGIIAAVLLVAWLIRRYIRRALALEQRRLGMSESHPVSTAAEPEVGYSLGVLTEPLREGVIDLRSLTSGGMSFTGNSSATPSPMSASERMTIGVLLRKYRLFLLFIIVVAGIAFFGYRYLRSSFTSDQHFKITDVRIGQEDVSK